MDYKDSNVVVFTGPMKSSKSKELFSVIDVLQHKNIPFLVFKPNIDSRNFEEIGSRYLNQKKIAINIDHNQPHDIFKHIDLSKINLPFAVIIDEAQFFEKSIVEVVFELSMNGVSCYIAGLDLDAKQKTFGSMGDLLALADEVKKFTSVCEICKGTATKTTLQHQCLAFEKNNILIDNNQSTQSLYVVTCNKCFRAKQNEKMFSNDKQDMSVVNKQ